jgi:hypothetical protein
MKKVTEAILILLATFALCFLQTNASMADGRKIDLQFNDQNLSAMIREAPIRDIIAELKKEKGIWFKLWCKGSEFVLDEKVTMQFSDLSVEEGLARIFSSMNYSLVFDEDDDVIGVVLLGKYQKTRRVRRRSLPYSRRTPRRLPRP